MAEIKISNIVKKYGEVAVLHGIDLDVRDQEFVALVGPSGCGKSTLLRIIAGLEEFDTGKVVIDGKVVNDLTPRERDVAMVFQSYALYPHMNVYNNMAFTLRMRGANRSDIDTKVREAALALNLADYLDRTPSQLSGGQRQRVAMGRALVRNARVFLFDEPLSNLDAKLRVEMRTEIRRLHQKIRATSIYVTHDQIEAMTMADRIIVLNSGSIVQQGPPRELYEKPASAFVATFIGSPEMNLFRGSLALEDGRTFVVTSDGSRIDTGRRIDDSTRDILWGVRPDGLTLCDPAAGQLRGKVGVIEYMGGETLVYVDTAIGVFCVTAPSTSGTRTGDEVGLDIQSSALHLFNASTGLRIESSQRRE